MAANGISTLSTKELRQIAKLELAQTKRQLAGTQGYRENRYYDLDLLPTKYSDNDVVNNPNVGGLQPGRPWKATPNILSGLWRSVYNNYWDPSEINDVAWFDSPALIPASEGAVTNFSVDDVMAATVSVQWLGYFQAPHTANYIFTIVSDDSSNFWIGDDAITGYTAMNADINLIGSSDPIALTAGQYYPIRVQYGNNGGPGSFEFSWEDDYTPPSSGNDFAFFGDQNMWVINGGFNAGSTFSDPAPTNPAYTYPDNSYTGKTYNFDGTTWMASTSLSIGGAWQSSTITIDYWFYPTANGIQLLSECDHADVTSGYHYSMLEINSSGYVKARFYGTGYPSSAIVSSNTVDLNAWNHIYFTEDSIGVHSFELNGVPTTGNPTYTRIKPVTEYFVIGFSDVTNLGSSGQFQGKIGYLNIHDYVVASTWTNTNARFRP